MATTPPEILLHQGIQLSSTVQACGYIQRKDNGRILLSGSILNYYVWQCIRHKRKPPEDGIIQCQLALYQLQKN